MSIFYFIFIFFALGNTSANVVNNIPDQKRIQTLAFVIDNHGNSTTDISTEAANCAQYFLSKISSGHVTVKEAAVMNGMDSVTQTHNIILHTDQDGIGCSLLWALTTFSKVENETENTRTKRSPQGLATVLHPLLTGLEGTLAATGLRKRRNIIDENLREKRSPLLGGLIDTIFGGGSSGDSGEGEDDEEESGEGEETQSRRIVRSPQGITIELDIGDVEAPPPNPE